MITCTVYISDQWIVIFPANRNRNRFAEPTSVRIGIGIVCEIKNLQIGIGIIFVRLEVFAKYSRIPEIYFFPLSFSNNFFFLTVIYFLFKKLNGQKSHSEIYAYFLYIFNIKIRYSWILWKIFVNRNNIRQITIFANRNTIHELKLWRIGIGIYTGLHVYRHPLAYKLGLDKVEENKMVYIFC